LQPWRSNERLHHRSPNANARSSLRDRRRRHLLSAPGRAPRQESQARGAAEEVGDGEEKRRERLRVHSHAPDELWLSVLVGVVNDDTAVERGQRAALALTDEERRGSCLPLF